MLCHVQRCAEADAAAVQLQQQADAVEEEEARAMLKQMVASVVSERDKGRRATNKASTFCSILYFWQLP